MASVTSMLNVIEKLSGAFLPIAAQRYMYFWLELCKGIHTQSAVLTVVCYAVQQIEKILYNIPV